MALLQPPTPTRQQRRASLHEAAAAWGLRIESDDEAIPDDDPDDVLAVWPDVMPSVIVMDRLATQWVVGFGGPVGLRYEVLPHVFAWLGVAADDQPRVFADVRVMEAAQLDHWASQQTRH